MARSRIIFLGGNKLLPLYLVLPFLSLQTHKESACKAGDLGWEDLEEEMATCSIILAWKKSRGLRSLEELQVMESDTTK